MDKEDLRLVLDLSKTIKDFDKEMIYLLRNLIEIHLEDIEEFKMNKQIINEVPKNKKIGAPVKNNNSKYMIKKYGKIQEPFEDDNGNIKSLD